jgi:hypothetical protein
MSAASHSSVAYCELLQRREPTDHDLPEQIVDFGTWILNY